MIDKTLGDRAKHKNYQKIYQNFDSFKGRFLGCLTDFMEKHDELVGGLNDTHIAALFTAVSELILLPLVMEGIPEERIRTLFSESLNSAFKRCFEAKETI